MINQSMINLDSEAEIRGVGSGSRQTSDSGLRRENSNVSQRMGVGKSNPNSFHIGTRRTQL